MPAATERIGAAATTPVITVVTEKNSYNRPLAAELAVSLTITTVAHIPKISNWMAMILTWHRVRNRQEINDVIRGQWRTYCLKVQETETWRYSKAKERSLAMMI